MAKGKISSPKKSRRGRRSPKKSKKTVHKVISKEVSEPVNRALEFHEAEDVQDPESAPIAEAVEEEAALLPVPSAKEMLTHFFASLSPDVQAAAGSLAQLEEEFFIFGKVAAMLAANGQFGDEVATNLAVVWEADETWTRSLLAGEVKPPEPEPEAPEEPEAAMEAQEEAAVPPAEEEAQTMEPAAEEVDMVETAEPAAEEMEVAEAPLVIQEPPLVQEAPAVTEPIVQEPVVEQPFVQESFVQQPFVQQPFVQQPIIQVQEMPVFEEPMAAATDKENVTNVMIAEKMPSAKQLGEQPAMHASPLAGLAPADVNVLQTDLA